MSETRTVANAGRACRRCGTPIPQADLIFEKFRRCYYCGRFNPLAGAQRRAVLAHAAAVVALAVLTVWWRQAFL